MSRLTQLARGSQSMTSSKRSYSDVQAQIEKLKHEAETLRAEESKRSWLTCARRSPRTD